MDNNGTSLGGTASVNPLMLLLLGACPAMAATTGVIPALAMAVITVGLMLITAIFFGALGKLIPAKVRIPAIILLNAALAGCAQMLLNAYYPDVFKMLGIYSAIAAINMVVICNAETACSGSFGCTIKRTVCYAFTYALAIILISAVRELIGSGSLAGTQIAAMKNYTVPLMVKAPGGFLALAVAMAVLNKTGCFPETDGTCPAAVGCEKKGE